MQDTTETNACPRCAHENTADTSFCANCGLRIDGLCPNCGVQNEHSTHFCVKCGHDFTATAVPRPAAAAGDLRGVPSAPAGPLPPQPTFPSRSAECPRCRRINEPGAAFCFNCGLPFDHAAGFQEGVYRDSDIPAYVGAKPGGFWIRLVAEIIDEIVVTALTSVLLLFTGTSIVEYLGGTTPWGMADVVYYGVGLLYAPLLLWRYATTVGKRAFNMRVVRVDGSRIGFWRAFFRELAKILSAIPFGAGFLMVAFRKDKRGLHDLLLDTVVVQR